MSLFDHQRLGNETFKLDIARMRQAWYTDKYFSNIAQMLGLMTARQIQYTPGGGYTRLGNQPLRKPILPGDLEVEMQWFTRRAGKQWW